MKFPNKTTIPSIKTTVYPRKMLTCAEKQNMRFFDSKFLLFLGFGLLLLGCVEPIHQFSGLAPGYWRMELQLQHKIPKFAGDHMTVQELHDFKFQETDEGVLPVNMEVIYDTKNDFHIEIINGDERIRVDDIKIGRDNRTAKDTVRIDFPLYDSYITGIYVEKIIQGFWVVKSRKNYKIPVVIEQGKKYRFNTIQKTPLADISGKWETTFGTDTSDQFMAIGEFKQNKNHLTATFATETGDFRFLEGDVQGDRISLSTFDGSHAFLFLGKIIDKDHITGEFKSGIHYSTLWNAIRNEDFQLRNPDSLTFIKEGYDKFEFEFPNTDGKMVNLNDEKYQGKAKIIQIMGTWCPNCRDESKFLTEYLKSHTNPNLEIIGLAFEKNKDNHIVLPKLKRYKEKMNMPYELLFAGVAKKEDAAKALPMLNHIMSYPTMIFLTKDNHVAKIHTGFFGPATDEYEAFKKDFNHFVDDLVKM